MVHKAILSELERSLIKKVMTHGDMTDLEVGAYRVLKTRIPQHYKTLKADFKLIKWFMKGG